MDFKYIKDNMPCAREIESDRVKNITNKLNTLISLNEQYFNAGKLISENMDFNCAKRHMPLEDYIGPYQVKVFANKINAPINMNEHSHDVDHLIAQTELIRGLVVDVLAEAESLKF
ncbi:hypothetical protein DFQ28_011527 [Apophysomyces sp. BC1034]|nr:hypothetical protein DFQ28_011527 [Apophysomyces sp. BC1034]